MGLLHNNPAAAKAVLRSSTRKTRQQEYKIVEAPRGWDPKVRWISWVEQRLANKGGQSKDTGGEY